MELFQILVLLSAIDSSSALGGGPDDDSGDCFKNKKLVPCDINFTLKNLPYNRTTGNCQLLLLLGYAVFLYWSC